MLRYLDLAVRLLLLLASLWAIGVGVWLLVTPSGAYAVRQGVQQSRSCFWSGKGRLDLLARIVGKVAQLAERVIRPDAVDEFGGAGELHEHGKPRRATSASKVDRESDIKPAVDTRAGRAHVE